MVKYFMNLRIVKRDKHFESKFFADFIPQRNTPCSIVFALAATFLYLISALPCHNNTSTFAIHLHIHNAINHSLSFSKVKRL